jgi:hypothetical protein
MASAVLGSYAHGLGMMGLQLQTLMQISTQVEWKSSLCYIAHEHETKQQREKREKKEKEGEKEKKAQNKKKMLCENPTMLQL